MEACRISSVVSLSVARAEPSASRGSSPRVTRHCRAGASPVPPADGGWPVGVPFLELSTLGGDVVPRFASHT